MTLTLAVVAAEVRSRVKLSLDTKLSHTIALLDWIEKTLSKPWFMQISLSYSMDKLGLVYVNITAEILS